MQDSGKIHAARRPGRRRPTIEAEALLLAPSLSRVEWDYMQRIIAACGDNLSLAARVLGVHRRTLQRRLAGRPPER